MGQAIIFSCGLTLNLFIAASDVANGTMTAGDFILIQAYFMQLSAPLFNMGMLFREVAQSQIDVEDLFNMLQQKPAVQELPNAKPFNFEKGLIEFKNISFGHKREKSTNSNSEEDEKKDDETLVDPAEVINGNGDEDVKYLFKNLDLKIEAGTTNAIVGPSGFGKTSMLHLLFRIYDPIDGEVLIDGQNIKECTFDSFRKHIVVVPQNGILFNDTIEANLLYGNPKASQEDIERVARQCSMHETIMSMQDGYQTQVGDLGSKLSGGER